MLRISIGSKECQIAVAVNLQCIFMVLSSIKTPPLLVFELESEPAVRGIGCPIFDVHRSGAVQLDFTGAHNSRICWRSGSVKINIAACCHIYGSIGSDTHVHCCKE